MKTPPNVDLPEPPSADATTERPDPIPDHTLPRKLDSEIHSVASRPLPPRWAQSVFRCSPKPRPTSVTDIDPVSATFVTPHPVRDNAASNETIRVKLPPNDRARVATAWTVPPVPTTALNRNDVDECHTEASVALPPKRTPALRSHVPALLPTNVTLVEAVEATFVRTAIDSDTVSNVTADVKLPNDESAVIETVAVVPNPEPLFAVMLVDVAQTVDCDVLPPIRADALPYPTPRLRPTSVTLVDAVVATFVRGTPVNVGRSNVIISLRVPVKPTNPVARIRRDAPLPTLCLNTIDVDECHADD